MKDNQYFEGNLDFLQKEPKLLEGGAFFYCEEGNATMCIGTQTFQIGPSTIVMLLPDTSISLKDCSESFKGVFWEFSQKFFDKLNASFSPTFYYIVVSNPVFKLDQGGANDEFIRTTLKLARMAVHSQAKINAFHEEMRIRNLAQILVVSVADWSMPMMGMSQPTQDRKRQLYHQFVLEVCHHSKTEHFIDFYCKKLCISRRYLADVVKECNPMTTPQFIIIDHIIFKLKRALLTTDKTVTQIADEFNFQNQSNMSSFFIRNAGISPTEYRNREALNRR